MWWWWWAPPSPPLTNIAGIPVSAAVCLNDFKQDVLHGSQTLLTYTQGNITKKAPMERGLASIKTHGVCVSLWELTHTLLLLCASVSLCICTCRGYVYKKSSTRCHTQTQKCRSERNNWDLPRLSGSVSLSSCIFLTSLLSQPLFHLNLCIFHRGQTFL